MESLLRGPIGRVRIRRRLVPAPPPRVAEAETALLGDVAGAWPEVHRERRPPCPCRRREVNPAEEDAG